ncbi:hypothetical protein EJ651_01725 [Campylobacter coli]|nr:hypothetical protein [Campylobacter coli]
MNFIKSTKKGSYPYLSLLGLKKLNNDNERLNYNNISPELVWELNFPLPNKYRLVWLFKSCSGSIMVKYNFLTQCEVGCQAYAWEEDKKMYMDMYNYISTFKVSIVLLLLLLKIIIMVEN